MSGVRSTSKPSAGPARVALVAGERTLHRMGRVVQHLSVGLVDEPLGLTLVAAQGADVSALPCPPVEVLRYPVPRPWRFHLRVVEPLAEALEEQNVEMLHGLDSTAHELTRALSEELGLPYVVSVWSLPGAREVVPLGPECRAVLAVSEAVRTALQSAGVAPGRIQIVRPAVHQSVLRAEPAPPGHSRAIIAAGRFEPPGPFEAVIQAFAELRRQGIDCVLFLLGEGPAEHRLRQTADRLGLMHHVTFVDAVPQAQLPGVFAAADLFVYPHSDRRLELELLEAMAAGVPALVGDCCVGDFAIEGQTSLAYRPDDASDLASKLRVLLEDPSSSTALADNARRYLREHHSPARMVAALAQLYREHALAERTLRLS